MIVVVLAMIAGLILSDLSPWAAIRKAKALAAKASDDSGDGHGRFAAHDG